ncbi:Serine/threonine-protein phosphatase 7 long form [Glycine max]|nr:Serine/threonine-protein phosphatase 7 long form [Glycine max]
MLMQRIDPALITTLVERWRPKTYTFHLSLGECTITLEDVALHLGIRVDGCVLCDELLGEVPPNNACKGATLKLTWLLNILCTPLPKEPTIPQLQCRCRAYIMYIIGGFLILDKSGNRVHLMYLNLLHDFDNIKKYSWGFACLENLYRELCQASSEVGRVMGGYVILLQSQAWYYIGGRLEHRGIPHGDLVGYRSRIDHMESHQFSWVPYRGFEDHLPRHANRDMDIWSAYTVIICFPIVEQHTIWTTSRYPC